MLKVADVMTRGPLVIDRHQSLAEATSRMEILDVHHLPVVDGARLAGMLSERDILRYLRGHPDVDPRHAVVADALTTEALAVGPDEPAAHVAGAMFGQGIDAATVVSDGHITGIFTATDALHTLAQAPDTTEGGGVERSHGWPRRVLCAVDFSTESRAAVNVAMKLAGSGGEVTLFHAYDVSIDGMLAGSTALEATRRDIEEGLHGWIKEHQQADGPRFAIAMSVGTAAEAITRHAREEAFDLIVVGSHGRDGAKRLILGSVAEAVARRAPCPVLVVRRSEVTGSRA